MLGRGSKILVEVGDFEMLNFVGNRPFLGSGIGTMMKPLFARGPRPGILGFSEGSIQPMLELTVFHPPFINSKNLFMQCPYVPGSKVAVLGMGDLQPLIGNPYNGYINPYYWVDDHPLLYGNNGSLDPSTYAPCREYLSTYISPCSCKPCFTKVM